MKRKFFAVLATVCAMVPCMVKAAEYNAGDYVNFAKNEADMSALKAMDYSKGMSTLIIAKDTTKDAGEGKNYYKVITQYVVKSSICTSDDESTCGMNGSLKDELYNHIAGNAAAPMMYQENDKFVIEIATKAEALAALKLASDATVGTKVTLTNDTKAWFNALTGGPMSSGTVVYAVTGEKKTGANTYYGFKVTKTANEKGLKVVSEVEFVDDIEATDDNSYVLAAVYMNDGYTCDSNTVDESACYKCVVSGKEVAKWSVLGSSDVEGCELMPTVSNKDKCIINPGTGVENYLIPAAVVLGVCAIVLTVVKRKDAFKAI